MKDKELKENEANVKNKSGLNSGSNDISTHGGDKTKLSKKDKETQKRKLIESDLLEQLRRTNRDTAYHKGLIEDYMFYYDLKVKMIRNINNAGLVITKPTGNGYDKKELNDNVQEIQRVTRLMLKILQDCGLQEPMTKEEFSVNDFL